jgi:hypothetical protein
VFYEEQARRHAERDWENFIHEGGGKATLAVAKADVAMATLLISVLVQLRNKRQL